MRVLSENNFEDDNNVKHLLNTYLSALIKVFSTFSYLIFTEPI